MEDDVATFVEQIYHVVTKSCMQTLLLDHMEICTECYATAKFSLSEDNL